MPALRRSPRGGGSHGARRGLGQTLDLLSALWALDQELRTLSRRMERHLGVTGPQRLALRIIGETPSLQAGALASVLHLHPSTVTGLVERLTRKGLVNREHDPADGRRVLLALTARGVRINRQRRGTAELAVWRVCRTLDPGRLAAARAVLELLRQSVKLERSRSGVG